MSLTLPFAEWRLNTPREAGRYHRSRSLPILSVNDLDLCVTVTFVMDADSWSPLDRARPPKWIAGDDAGQPAMGRTSCER
jgi:hypothetical protein